MGILRSHVKRAVRNVGENAKETSAIAEPKFKRVTTAKERKVMEKRDKQWMVAMVLFLRLLEILDPQK